MGSAHRRRLACGLAALRPFGPQFCSWKVSSWRCCCRSGFGCKGAGLWFGPKVPGPPVVTTIDVVKTETGDLFPRSKGSSVQPCKVSHSPGTPTRRHYDCTDPLFVDKSHAGAASWHGFHFHVFARPFPGALNARCQVAGTRPPPRPSSSCTPHPPTSPSFPFPRSQSPLSCPHLHLHLNSIRPRCNPPGAWARASGSSPPVRHPTCQHPCMQPFLEGSLRSKVSKFCSLAHLSLLAGRCHHWAEGYLPQATFLRAGLEF